MLRKHLKLIRFRLRKVNVLDEVYIPYHFPFHCVLSISFSVCPDRCGECKLNAHVRFLGFKRNKLSLLLLRDCKTPAHLISLSGNYFVMEY
jgi:hypothetical protein